MGRAAPCEVTGRREPQLHAIVEPRPQRVLTVVFVALFPVVGLAVLVTLLRTDGGPVPFLVLWFALFAGIPGWMVVHMLRGRGTPGFVVSQAGLHGAADDEQGMLPWHEVRALEWAPTGTRVNGVPLLALTAELHDGTRVRVSSHASGLRSYRRRVEEQLAESGVVPGELLPRTDAVRSRDVPATPPPDALLGDPFADLPRRTAPPPPPPASSARPDDAPHWPTRDR